VGTVALRVSFVNKNRPALQDDVNGAIAEAFFEKFYSEIFNTDEDFRCLFYQTRVARLFNVPKRKYIPPLEDPPKFIRSGILDCKYTIWQPCSQPISTETHRNLRIYAKGSMLEKSENFFS
jgi:hypothetical protein